MVSFARVECILDLFCCSGKCLLQSGETDVELMWRMILSGIPCCFEMFNPSV